MKLIHNHKHRHYQQGVTLVELIISIVVVGIAMASIMSALQQGIVNSAQPMWESKALELTQAYADEILAMNFAEESVSGGGEVATCNINREETDRQDFDDVDDYHNLSDAPPELIDNPGDMASDYVNYQVNVTVSCAGTQLGFPSNAYAKHVSITVVVPSGQTRTVSFYRGNF